MDNLAIERHAPGHGIAAGLEHAPAQHLKNIASRGGRRDITIDLACSQGDAGVVSAAKASSSLDNSIQHRLQIEGRAADDLQYIAGRGLVFERFLEIARALAQLAKKPRVLDRDRGMFGKGSRQLDLHVTERPNLLPIDGDGADEPILPEHWHREKCA